MHVPFHAEVALAAAYALFLFAAGKVLEWFGRHSHARSGQFRTAGFTYQRHLDAWRCPTGHHLQRQMDPPPARRVRYRAAAHVCNGCPYKANCTDSDEGRELEFTTLGWIESESGRFHRGLGCVLWVLAAFILLVEMVRFRSGTEAVVLRTEFALAAALIVRRLRTLSRPSAAASSAVSLPDHSTPRLR